MSRYLLPLLFAVSACSHPPVQPPAAAPHTDSLQQARTLALIDSIYAPYKVAGCFILHQVGHTPVVYAPERARQPMCPASTFKIPNSLIALETGVVRDTTEKLQWDGVKRRREEWNQDLNLRQAFQYSAVWYYQEMARRVGAERMQHYVDGMAYGNRDLSGGVDQFWLESSLLITPLQQDSFLCKVVKRELPFSNRSQDLLRGIMVADTGKGWVLRAKTGWYVDAQENNQGWYVGWVERDAENWVFVHQVAFGPDSMMGLRKDISLEILRASHLID